MKPLSLLVPILGSLVIACGSISPYQTAITSHGRAYTSRGDSAGVMWNRAQEWLESAGAEVRPVSMFELEGELAEEGFKWLVTRTSLGDSVRADITTVVLDEEEAPSEQERLRRELELSYYMHFGLGEEEWEMREEMRREAMEREAEERAAAESDSVETTTSTDVAIEEDAH